MADGKVFIGKQGINAGLIDGISSLDDLINSTLPKLQKKENFKNMKPEQLNKEYPELANALIRMGKKNGRAIAAVRPVQFFDYGVVIAVSSTRSSSSGFTSRTNPTPGA